MIKSKNSEDNTNNSIDNRIQKILIVGDVNHTLLKQLSEEMKDKFSFSVDILSLFGSYHRNDKYFSKLYSVSLPSVAESNNLIKIKINQIFYYKVIKDIIKQLDYYDVINIHYLNPIYRFFVKDLRAKTSKLYVTMWGSDFYRVNDKTRVELKKVFNFCDLITFTNDSMKNDFLNYYCDYQQKVKVCRFGLEVLKHIDEVKSSNKFEECKNDFLRKYNINSQKKIIACGYNSGYGQQHEKIIEAIRMINKEKLNDVLFLFPMAYGDEKNKRKVELLLQNCDFSYKVLTDYLEGTEIALLRVISDVMINVQTTDQFSGSMQETLYAGNVLINGGWLPYSTFKQEGAFFLEVNDFTELSGKIEFSIDNCAELKSKTKNNRDIIWKLSSWEKNSKDWYNLYKKGGN